MQKSNCFVLYHIAERDANGYVVAYEYLKQIRYRGGPDDKTTRKLNEAVVLGKADAFKMAIEEADGNWSVGELISTNNGVRVEE